MNYEELPKEIKKSVSDTLTIIELFGARALDMPKTLENIVTKAYDLGYCDGVEYEEKNPPIRPNY